MKNMSSVLRIERLLKNLKIMHWMMLYLYLTNENLRIKKHCPISKLHIPPLVLSDFFLKIVSKDSCGFYKLENNNMKNFYLYILRCRDGSYYVGHTDDLDKRMSEHNLGLHEGYTAARRPVELIAMQTFYTRDEAFAAERKIKKWTRVKKEAFIRSDWNEISRLAKKIF